jgi:tetrahydromethanopterin S-methyltransferase subunit H
MFRFATPQKVFRIGDIAVGGQPGERPPLLIGSMFHNKDRILESRKERRFDRAKARDILQRAIDLSQQTGVPFLVSIVANSADELKTWIEFYSSVTNLPFGIDIWAEKTRIAAAEAVAQMGLVDRLLYTSITPWDKDIPNQVTTLRQLGVKHVMVQVFDEEDKLPPGRLKSLQHMLELIAPGEFESILVDTAGMNLWSSPITMRSNYLIKQEIGLPCGFAQSNSTWMWEQAREMWGWEGFAAVDAAAQAIAALCWNDFLLFGPTVTAKRIIPAVATAALLLPAFANLEGAPLPADPGHPLRRFFGDDKFYQQFAAQASGG